MRSAGMLLHISALPSPYGIGTMGWAAYDFIDYLKTSGMHIWQVLPVSHPSSYGNSPYQAYSTFAGNPYFIDLDMLVNDGLLEKSEIEEAYRDFDDEKGRSKVDFDFLRLHRLPLVKKAAHRLVKRDLSAVTAFIRENPRLYEYSLFMALKEADNSEEILIWQSVQYLFFRQWSSLKKYANENGIEIFGDCPIYTAMDSAEVWAHPELFELDRDKKPVSVAGCPPDAFAPEGQKWGSPLYNYDLMEKDGYNWLINRIDYCCNIYDILRIDHFRGFDSYFAIPADKPASCGEWRQGPGMKLFNSLNYWMGRKKIVAEDLGIITDSVGRLLDESGYPGMKVMQFAFNGDSNNKYLPHNFIRNCVAYIGTHDNATLKEWIDGASEQELAFIRAYTGNTDIGCINKDLIRTLYESVADTVIITLQDVLSLGAEARFNTPGTVFGNWSWRATPEMFNEADIAFLRNLSEITGRG